MQRLFDGQLPEALLFDLDGTLVDSVPDLAWAIQQMLAALSLPSATEQQVRDWVGNGAVKLVERALKQSSEEQAEALFDEAYVCFLEQYRDHLAVDTCLYEGVRPFLSYAQAEKIPMAVVTNKPYAFSQSILKSLQLSEFFSVVIGGDSCAEKKPHPMPLLEAARQLGVRAERCLMVGDSINDVSAARAASMPVVAVPYGYNHGQPIENAQPDLIVARLDQLIRVN